MSVDRERSSVDIGELGSDPVQREKNNQICSTGELGSTLICSNVRVMLKSTIGSWALTL
jgi:hypothetical protein